MRAWESAPVPAGVARLVEGCAREEFQCSCLDRRVHEPPAHVAVVALQRVAAQERHAAHDAHRTVDHLDRPVRGEPLRSRDLWRQRATLLGSRVPLLGRGEQEGAGRQQRRVHPPHLLPNVRYLRYRRLVACRLTLAREAHRLVARRDRHPEVGGGDGEGEPPSLHHRGIGVARRATRQQVGVGQRHAVEVQVVRRGGAHPQGVPRLLDANAGKVAADGDAAAVARSVFDRHVRDEVGERRRER